LWISAAHSAFTLKSVELVGLERGTGDSGRNDRPVDGTPELREVFGLSVLIVNVPGMFPRVNAEDWVASVLDWVSSVRVLVDSDRLVCVDRQIRPATSEDR
jgi:hypothetical protein